MDDTQLFPKLLGAFCARAVNKSSIFVGHQKCFSDRRGVISGLSPRNLYMMMVIRRDQGKCSNLFLEGGEGCLGELQRQRVKRDKHAVRRFLEIGVI